MSEARWVADVEVDTVEDDVASEDVTVLVSINRDVEEALRESRDQIPSLRGYVRLRGMDGDVGGCKGQGAETDLADPSGGLPNSLPRRLSVPTKPDA